jgi:hypothetical protein
MTKFLTCADIPTKETKGEGADCMEPEPTNLDANRQDALSWQQWYELFWKLKLARWQQDNR